MAKLTMRIAAIVDANGRWAAQGWTNMDLDEPDWQWIDESADHENDLVCPRRFWITVEVELPTIGEVTGVVEDGPSS